MTESEGHAGASRLLYVTEATTLGGGVAVAAGAVAGGGPAGVAADASGVEAALTVLLVIGALRAVWLVGSAGTRSGFDADPTPYRRWRETRRWRWVAAGGAPLGVGLHAAPIPQWGRAAGVDGGVLGAAVLAVGVAAHLAVVSRLG
jgi:hypothetical protein